MYYYIDTDRTEMKGKTILKHLSKLLYHHKLAEKRKCSLAQVLHISATLLER